MKWIQIPIIPIKIENIKHLQACIIISTTAFEKQRTINDRIKCREMRCKSDEAPNVMAITSAHKRELMIYESMSLLISPR